MSITLVAPPAEIKALVRLVVTRPDGKVVSDSGEQEAHSFLIQFLEFVYGIFKGLTLLATNIVHAEDYIVAAGVAYQGWVCSPINTSNYGIVIGTGAVAETNIDYKLATQILEGSTAGKMTHNQGTINAAPAVVGANVDFILFRSFTNNSGALITVTETGIYMYTNYVSQTFCVIRDVLASAIDVPDKCSVTVLYTLRTAV